MGLMDKVKAQATQIAEKAQEAGKVGQAKLEGVQAKRKADSLLEELGKITYDAHEGRSTPGGEQRASDLVEQLRQYEAEYGPLGGDGAPVAHSATPEPTAPQAPVPTPSAGAHRRRPRRSRRARRPRRAQRPRQARRPRQAQ